MEKIKWWQLDKPATSSPSDPVVSWVNLVIPVSYGITKVSNKSFQSENCQTTAGTATISIHPLWRTSTLLFSGCLFPSWYPFFTSSKFIVFTIHIEFPITSLYLLIVFLLSSFYLMRLMIWWWWRCRKYFRTRRTRCGTPGFAFSIRVLCKAWRTAGTATKYFSFILACSRLTHIYLLFFTIWLDSWF